MKKNNLKLFASMLVFVMLVTVAFAIPALAAEKAGSLYITQVNKPVAAGSGTVFSASYNGTNSVLADPTEGNFRWATYFTAKPTGTAGVFEVVVTGANIEVGTTAVTIPEGGFIYAAHVDDYDTSSDVYTNSNANAAATALLVKGNKVTLVGVDLITGTMATDAKVTIGGVAVDTSAVVSEPASATSSEVSDEPSIATVSKNDSSVATSSPKVSTPSDVSEAEVKGDNTLLFIGLGAVVVIAIAAIVFMSTRKKEVIK